MSTHPSGVLTCFLLSTYYKLERPFHLNTVKVGMRNHKRVLLPSPHCDPFLNFALDPQFYVSAKPKAAGSSTSSANDYTVSWSQSLDWYGRYPNLLQWGLGYRVIFEVSQQKKKQKDPRKDTESYPSILFEIIDLPMDNPNKFREFRYDQIQHITRFFWADYVREE